MTRSCSRFRALHDMFDRGDPSAIRQQLVDDLDCYVRPRLSGYCGWPYLERTFSRRSNRIPVERRRRSSLSPSMPVRSAEMTTRLCRLRRHTIRVDVAFVAKDDAGRCVVQRRGPASYCSGGIEPMLSVSSHRSEFLILPGRLPDDQEQDKGDRQRGRNSGNDNESGLRAPVGQRGGDGHCRDNHAGKRLRGLPKRAVLIVHGLRTRSV